MRRVANLTFPWLVALTVQPCLAQLRSTTSPDGSTVRSDRPPVVVSVAAPTTVVTGTPVLLVVEASDNNSVVRLTAEWSDGNVQTEIRDGGTSVRSRLSIPSLGQGSETVRIQAVDNAGLASRPYSVTIESVYPHISSFVLNGDGSAALVAAQVSSSVTARIETNVNAPRGGFAIDITSAATCMTPTQPGFSAIEDDCPALSSGIYVPPRVDIRGGANAVEFSIPVGPVVLPGPSSYNRIEGTVSLGARLSGWTGDGGGGAIIWVDSPPQVAQLSGPTPVQGGQTIEWIVELKHPDGSEPQLHAPVNVQLSSSNPDVAAVPANVSVPTGRFGDILITNAPAWTEVPIQISPVAQPTMVTITATDGVATVSSVLGVSP